MPSTAMTIRNEVMRLKLIKALDKEATLTNVHEFFLNDRYYPTIRRRSGSWTVRSPTMDISSVPAAPAGNATERKYLEIVHYRQAIKAVNYAIAGCCARSRSILKYEYQQRLQIKEVKELVRLYGHDTYADADRYACFEFAETMDTARIMYAVTDIVPKMQQELNRN